MSFGNGGKGFLTIGRAEGGCKRFRTGIGMSTRDETWALVMRIDIATCTHPSCPVHGQYAWEPCSPTTERSF